MMSKDLICFAKPLAMEIAEDLWRKRENWWKIAACNGVSLRSRAEENSEKKKKKKKNV